MGTRVNQLVAAVRPEHELPRVFGRYLLLERISESLMSEIYLARLNDEHPLRLVVAKLLHPANASHFGDRRLFVKEIETTVKLIHPNIVPIFDFGAVERTPFLIMEWIAGKTLRQVIERSSEKHGRPISTRLALKIMTDVALALEYAHGFTDPITGASVCVLHRDVTPHNILLNYEGGVKLIDFGISKIANDPSQTQTDVLRGKPGYKAPEQVSGREMDARSDLFSFGAVFYELLTGEKLFHAANDFATLERIRNSDVLLPAISERLRAIDTDIARIVVRCLRNRPEERYPSARALLEDLGACVETLNHGSDRTELRDAVTELFAERIPAERERNRALLCLKPDQEGRSPGGATLVAIAGGASALDSARPGERVVPAPEPVPPLPATRDPLNRAAAALAATVLAACGIFLYFGWLNARSDGGLSPSPQPLFLELSPHTETPPNVFVDGRQVALTSGKVSVLDTDEEVKLTILLPGYIPYDRVLTFPVLRAHSRKVAPLKISLVPNRPGYLTVTGEPDVDQGQGPALTIRHEDETWERSSPFRNFWLPSGDYTIERSDDSSGRKIPFTIRENERTTIDVRKLLDEGSGKR